MLEDKYIGLSLAISSSLAIGTSYIITKKGLIDAGRQAALNGHSASDNLAYLKNPTWWLGMVMLVLGEIFNFSAYTFAPAVLVTPLGALSVIIGAILASFLLNEKLGRLGICGCALCLIGSLIIILHAPADKEVETVDEIWGYALQPSFLFYLFIVTVYTLLAINILSPKLGKSNPLIYISICSLVGSISVMSIKGLGVALKVTFTPPTPAQLASDPSFSNNQFTHLPTYIFLATTVGCIVLQMNYFNKALDTFSTNVVNPMYYVFFSTATLVASMILFGGLGTQDVAGGVSLVCGFLVIFMGVYLLNLSRDPEPPRGEGGAGHGGRGSIGDGSLGLESGLMNPRMSMSTNRYSSDATDLEPLHSAGHGRRSSLFRQQSSNLFDSFNEETVGLTELPEEDEPRRSTNANNHSNPHGIPPRSPGRIGRNSRS